MSDETWDQSTIQEDNAAPGAPEAAQTQEDPGALTIDDLTQMIGRREARIVQEQKRTAYFKQAAFNLQQQWIEADSVAKGAAAKTRGLEEKIGQLENSIASYQQRIQQLESQVSDVAGERDRERQRAEALTMDKGHLSQKNSDLMEMSEHLTIKANDLAEDNQQLVNQVAELNEKLAKKTKRQGK